ncbi:MAG: RNA polymerase sigma factor [Solirubrobacterales bacterium]
MRPSAARPRESTTSDLDLAGRVAEGDERAFEELDRRHRPAVERQCLRLLSNRHDAEEAAQTAMINAFTALRDGKRPRAFTAWILTIARNAAFDLMRRRTPDDPIPDSLPSPVARPEDHLIVLEEVRALCADLDELPDGQREAMVLRAFADLPHREVALRLGCTEVEARTFCKEARRTLDEFDAGRRMECAAVRERVAGEDRRALRARRVRAHLRACDPCRDLAEATCGTRGWSRVRGLLPLPLLAYMRRLVAGVGATVVAKTGGGMLAVVTSTATIAILGGAAVDSASHRHPVPGPEASARQASAPAAEPAAPEPAVGEESAPTPSRAARAVGAVRPAAGRGPAEPAPAGGGATPGAPAASPGPAPDPAPAPAGGGPAPAPDPVPRPGAGGDGGGAPAPGAPAAPAPGAAAVTVSVPPVTLPSVTVTPPVPLPPAAVPPVAVSTPGITLPGLVSVPPVTVTTPGISVGPGGGSAITVALPPLLGR